jgi:hypothetical protein
MPGVGRGPGRGGPAPRRPRRQRPGHDAGGDRLSLYARQGVDVRRVALNLDQVETFEPPPNPAKESDKRFDSPRGRTQFQRASHRPARPTKHPSKPALLSPAPLADPPRLAAGPAAPAVVCARLARRPYSATTAIVTARSTVALRSALTLASTAAGGPKRAQRVSPVSGSASSRESCT